ncbi:hypothetical protein M407DRAFT_71300 [Tulasnella calospora MUT 4182]|uniref:G-patch domain-containing protein n=1 Tax=Tulasnella calospora MUT 4182 TaxID=1051891 RepID=A0A0C3QD81_9AGAM|nr:hypothetical protein M407DRAFT_71300 [Tulasnella calospora MUT 4182]
MSEEEDDYLSDKFLAQLEQSSSNKPRTYHERRREVKRSAEQKNIANRIRSRREIEEESRREGLSKSLFERAREEEDRARKRRKLSESDQEGFPSDPGEPEQPKNKALAMMLRMGFKEGQSLGKADDGPPPNKSTEGSVTASSENREGTSGLVEPIPLAMWAGRQGLGSGRRIFAVNPSPQAPNVPPNGLAPVTQDEARSQTDYLNRAREEFEQKRDFGRLAKARKTLVELDEKQGVPFNILWIEPTNAETIPEPMLIRLEKEGFGELASLAGTVQPGNKSESAQLRAQMRLDALRPLASDTIYGAEEDDGLVSELVAAPPKVVSDQAMDFDVDTVQDRLRFTLQHLRQEYVYCFWCGAQYVDRKEMDELCPGESEEAHD